MLSNLFGVKSFQYINTSPRNRGGPKKTDPVTDLTKWRLTNIRGRQMWSYLDDDVGSDDGESRTRPQTFLEKYLLGIYEPQVITVQPGKNPMSSYNKNTGDQMEKNKTLQSLERGSNFLTRLQAEDGHWPGDYGGPLFLMPGLIIACHLTNTELNIHRKKEMVRYLRSVQCPSGGWGLHTEGPPTVLGTTLNYVCMRLLGVSQHDPDLKEALSTLKSMGGPLAIPSWGKFWLSVLNVYCWDGAHSLTPEIWCLPECLPFHPSRMWCHTRQVYLGMSYCYAVRLRAEETELIRQLRKELYDVDYDRIDWPSQRNNISSADLYTPHSCLLDVVYFVADCFESHHSTTLRGLAIESIYDNICFDDDVTHCISVGPVSKVIQMMVRHHRDGPIDRKQLTMHRERIVDYLWMGLDGMKMSGTNGSQLWDSAFVMQALLEVSNSISNQKLDESLRKGLQFLRTTQMDVDNKDFKRYYRQSNKGGFPFSTYDCGWIVADCTAEALKTTMMMETKFGGNDDDDDRHIPGGNDDDGDDDSGGGGDDDDDKGWKFLERCRSAVDLLLSMQNDDGGYATYERKRGGWFLEVLNPSEVFGDIMIDYSYVECTSAVMQALRHFNLYTDMDYKSGHIKKSLEHGLEFIVANQNEDGSYYGSWGVCFTYGTWFALEAFHCMGFHYTKTPHPSLTRACDWLASKQRPADGGWGERFESCEIKRYVEADEAQVVNTAWALMGLMCVGYPDKDCIERGVKFLLSKQFEDGSFPQQHVAGVFNKSCSIHYDLYRNVFPLWALARYNRIYML